MSPGAKSIAATAASTDMGIEPRCTGMWSPMAITRRLAIEDRAGIVAALLDIGRERGAPQRRAHLLRDGVHGALKDREFDRIACRRHALHLFADGMTRLPKPSTARMHSGGSTVAAVYSVIIAGPWIVSPGMSASRR